MKAGLSKISNACGVGVLAYHWEDMDYICSLNNYIARESLGNWLPFEAFRWKTPDISMIRFKSWEPVFYWNWTNKAENVLMHPGRFVGFSWSIGNLMTFEVIQCNEDPRKRNVFCTEVS